MNLEKDFIFYSDKEGGIHSGGFSVDSLMLKGGFSPIMTLNSSGNQLGGSGINQMSSLFDGLAVPYWATMYGGASFRDEDNEENTSYNFDEEELDNENEIMPNDIHEELLKLVSIDDKAIKGGKKKTRRQINKKSRTKRANKN